VPALFVDADLMSAIDQVAGLHRTVAEIDPATEALHFCEQVFIPPVVDLQISKMAGYRRDPGWGWTANRA
jgi:hypothetical protein